MRDPGGRSRGFAFLRFEEAASVDAVMGHGEHILDGKVVRKLKLLLRQFTVECDIYRLTPSELSRDKNTSDTSEYL
jgi:RNA-binding protein Musashi